MQWKNWAANEWLSSLLKTSKFLGMIPDVDMAIDWVPVDEVTCIISDIVFWNASRNTTGSFDDCLKTCNLVNPRPSSWTALLSTLQKQWTTAKIVYLQEWADTVEMCNHNGVDQLENMPALKMMPYFHTLIRYQQMRGDRSHPLFVIDNTSCASHTMARLQPVDEALLESWLH